MRPAVRLLLCGMLLAALVSVWGCATTLEAATTRPRSSSDLQAQVFKLQKDTARILALLEEEDGRSSVDAQAACAEVAARLVEIERRMGAIEEQLLATQSRIDDAVTEVRTLRRTLPYTFGRAEDTTGAGHPAVPSGGAAPADTRLSTGPRPDEGSPAIEQGGGAPPVPASPEDRFNAAYADFSRGNYDLALTEFEQALRADPNGPLAATCQYFIGETLMAMSRYADAVAAFDQLISAYPDSQRVLTARLKRGIALFESRRTVEAVQALQDLINEEPDSDEARIAEEYLRRKGIEAN